MIFSIDNGHGEKEDAEQYKEKMVGPSIYKRQELIFITLFLAEKRKQQVDYLVVMDDRN